MINCNNKLSCRNETLYLNKSHTIRIYTCLVYTKTEIQNCNEMGSKIELSSSNISTYFIMLS